MHNKVVHRMARGMRHAGHVVLRFNFRGVNLSEGKHDQGIGEVEDASAALQVLRERYPALPYSIAGFSFGSRVALRLAQRHPTARRAIAVGFPALYPGLEALRECPIPRIFVHSTNDSICAPAPAHDFYQSLDGDKRFVWVEAADHFFGNALAAFEETIRNLG